jgi:hypothetical protein
MAFHPFQIFRRHQKKWMAGLVIMCMFIFVLSSGIGQSDLITRMTQWFGTSRQGEKKVTEVYGKKVTDLDLLKLRNQREMANKLVNGLVGQAVMMTMFDLQFKKEAMQEFDKDEQAAIQQILRARNMSKASLAGGHRQLQVMEQIFLEKGETGKLEKVRQLMRALEMDLWRNEKPAGETLYFGGSLGVQDLLDFVMWRQIADKLGITLTPADIRAEINRETFNYQPLEEAEGPLVERVKRMTSVQDPNLSAHDIYDALGDELRVSMAQSAVLGAAPGVRGYRNMGKDLYQVPSTATPDEFFKFYEDNRTTLRVEMLPIKVSAFLDKVGKPPQDDATKQELRDLFERYKDDEYTPDRDQPAFREPRRLSIEWIGGRGDSKHRRDLADKFMLSAFVAGAGGSPIPAWAIASQIAEEYDRRSRFTYRMPRLLEGEFESAFYREPLKGEDVASAIGLGMGALGTGAPADSVRAGFTAGLYGRNRPAASAAIAAETQRRAGVNAALVASGLNGWCQSALFGYADRAEQSLPFDFVKKEVSERVRDEIARSSLVDDLQTVQKELEKLKGKSEEERKKEIDKYLAKAIKDYGLSHGTTDKPRDQFDISDDKGLQSMRDAFRRVVPIGDDGLDRFFLLFFDDSTPWPTFVPKQWPLPGLGFWEVADEPTLFWKTEDKKAYTPTYEEAEPKVIEAWRQKKAGELALKEAERIQQELDKVKERDDRLKYLREESAKNPSWGDIFAIDNIARLARPIFATGPLTMQYAPYRPKDSQIKARTDFADQLLRALKENGDTTILWNRPATTYYVALLTSIYHPDEMKFYQEYSDRHILGDNLWLYMEDERRNRFKKELADQLRNEAGATKGKWEVSEENRKRIEGRSSGSDE